MPNMDGFELANQMEKIDKNAKFASLPPHRYIKKLSERKNIVEHYGKMLDGL